MYLHNSEATESARKRVLEFFGRELR
jgi:hypothetical protein